MLWFLNEEIIWFLPGILFLGMITSYTDIKEGKIRNKHVLFAPVYSLVIYFTLALFIDIRTSYFIELAVMCGLSLATGFVLWYLGLWTAGDAKLLFAFSALVPLSVYKYGHTPYVDFLNILINTFVPIFIYFASMLMLKTRLKQKIFFLKKSFQPKGIFRFAVALFAILWVTELLLGVLKIQLGYFVIMFLIFSILLAAERFMFMRTFTVMIAVSVLRLIFDHDVYSINFIRMFFITLLVFVLVRFFVIRMSFFLLTQEVDIKLLKEGMIPAEFVYTEHGKYKKEEPVFFSIFGYMRAKVLKRDYVFRPMEPLSHEEVNTLKKRDNNLGFEHIRVHQTVSFAPFLFLGVLLTILVQGNVFVVIARLIL